MIASTITGAQSPDMYREHMERSSNQHKSGSSRDAASAAAARRRTARHSSKRARRRERQEKLDKQRDDADDGGDNDDNEDDSNNKKKNNNGDDGGVEMAGRGDALSASFVSSTLAGVGTGEKLSKKRRRRKRRQSDVPEADEDDEDMSSDSESSSSMSTSSDTDSDSEGLGEMGLDVRDRVHCEHCPYQKPLNELSGFEWFRTLVHLTLEDPHFSPVARVLSMFIMLLILLSTVAFCMETIPELADSPFWYGLEFFVVVVFTVEYVARLMCSCKLLSFVTSPLNVVDLFAVLPFYIDQLGDSGEAETLRVFRVVRLARIFRLFKISRYSSYMQIMGEAMKRSSDAFGLLLFFISIAVIIFSSLMYFAEKDTVDESGEHVFRSIPATFYWCIVTMTTVGYGDIFPRTTFGKIIASVTMICGILVIALPVTILGSNFSDVYSLHKRKKSSCARRRT
eukprot:TRINITY_DN67713_c1_g1_i1.p2 TRINITY_DN67713_c1_g1~~TRINITY_DN67713_c1_g1_i1.p2  ORF type:complete len:454 (+),score=242.72 TRINITY_DN67713_c1_g1_i1:83-1444(+)